MAKALVFLVQKKGLSWGDGWENRDQRNPELHLKVRERSVEGGQLSFWLCCSTKTKTKVRRTSNVNKRAGRGKSVQIL